MTRRARTCCVVIRTGGARRWSVCIPKESKVVVVVFFVVLFDHWPNTNTYGFLASLGRPHWAGKLVRTSLPRSHSPALHGSLPGAWRKDALIEAAGGSGEHRKFVMNLPGNDGIERARAAAVPAALSRRDGKGAP